ncbi:hypothetical protein [Treponema parvum]|uniref:hypothetical protein n=1 Tax=Treponema parvum TaxID=138851 RepID=UPI001AEBEB69|nr:hypothetical protein [Treponema parvum]QTQ16757.1 hypothetical protein HXT04_08670 [Treponema parvum]
MHGAILALVIINMLEKLRIPPVGILSIAFLFYFIGLAGQSYYNIFRKFPIWDNSFVHYIGVSFLSVLGVGGTRHGLFFAFPFVYLGMEIYRHRDSINLKQSVIIFLISMVVGFFEAITTLELHLGIRWDLMIFIVPASYSLFCVLLKIPIDIKIDTHVFRTLSHDIYFIHGALIMLYTYFNLYFHSILYFGTILFVAIAISVLKSVIINFFKEIVNKNVR